MKINLKIICVSVALIIVIISIVNNFVLFTKIVAITLGVGVIVVFALWLLSYISDKYKIGITRRVLEQELFSPRQLDVVRFRIRPIRRGVLTNNKCIKSDCAIEGYGFIPYDQREAMLSIIRN